MDRILKHDKLERALRSICGDCLFVFEVDLREDTYLSLMENPEEMGFPIPEEGVYSGLNEQFCSYVAEEYRDMRREFGSITFLRKMLMEKKDAECDYAVGSGKNEWWRDSFHVMEYDGDEPVKIAWEHLEINRIESFRILCCDIKKHMNLITGTTAIARSYLNDKECVRDSLDTISQAIREMYLLFDRAGNILDTDQGTDCKTFSLSDTVHRVGDDGSADK